MEKIITVEFDEAKFKESWKIGNQFIYKKK